MKVNEVLEEALPGISTGLKAKLQRSTGRFGQGANEMRQIKLKAAAAYKKWIVVVKALAASQRLTNNDPNKYITYLFSFMYKELKLDRNDTETINKIKTTLGPIPKKNSIQKAFELAIADYISQKYISKNDVNQAPAQPTANTEPEA